MARATQDGHGLSRVSASTPSYPRFSPWWTPWGLALRVPRVLREPSDVRWLMEIGWFIARSPSDLGRSHLSDFLGRTAAANRPAAHGVDDAAFRAATERVIRLRTPWLRLPWLRRRNTCYMRALTLLRFLDPQGRDVRFKVAAEWFDKPGGVLRGHAWLTVDGEVVDGPPEVDSHTHLQPITIEVGREAERRAAKWT